VTGRAVVVRFSVEVPGPALNVTGFVVKLHAAWEGTLELQLNEMLAANDGEGVNVTVYTAVWPAAPIVWLAGLTATAKSVACAPTEVWLLDGRGSL